MPDRRVAVRIDADVSPYNRGLLEAATRTKAFAHELESADGRMANLVQTGLALAPALVPIGAVAVPAIAGLTNQLGFATIAAGSALLAFNGVGDGLKALNEYRLEPTAANLEKVRETMAQLGPEGRDFVRQLADLGPELDQLRDAAEAGLLPGLGDAIDDLQTRLPEFEGIVSAVTGTLGDLTAEAGDALAGPEWDEFFDDIERRAPETLSAMGHALGDIAAGLADLWMDLEPLETDFNRWLTKSSQGFHDWADGLDETQGFEDFLEYAEENSPKVADAIGSMGNAVVQLVEAAAPVGSVVLPGLAHLADALAQFADTGLGSGVIALGAAVGVLGRSLALFRAAGGGILGTVLGPRYESMKSQLTAASSGIRSLSSATTELRSAQAALTTTATRARDAQFALIPTADKRAALADYTKAQERVKKATLGVAEAEKQRRAGMRRTALAVGKTAALVGGVGLVASGAADKMGLANTASLTLAGSMAGPLGAALGGAAGLFLDVKSEADQTSEAFAGLDEAISSGSFDAMKAKISGLQTAIDDLQTSSGPVDFLGDLFNKLDGNGVEQAREDIEGLRSAMDLAARDKAAEALAQGFELTSAGAHNAAMSVQDFTTQVATMEARLSKRASLRDYQAALDQFTQSVKDNGRTLDINTEAGRKNQEALDNIAATALKVAKGLHGLNRVKTLQQARRDFVDAATKAGMARGKAQRLANRLISMDNIKSRPSIELRGYNQTMHELNAVQGLIGDISGSHQVTMHVSKTGAPTTSLAGLLGVPSGGGADGTTIPGARYPYGDKLLYAVAPGEEIISNRYGQADMNRAELKAANAGAKLAVVGYADGGTAGDMYSELTQAWSDDFGLGRRRHIDSLVDAIRALKGELKRQHDLSAHERKVLNRHLDHLEKLQGRRRDVREAGRSFDVTDALPGHEPPNPIRHAVMAEVRDFRRAIKQAGGEWTHAMQRQAHRISRASWQMDQLTSKRKRLTKALDDQQASLEELQSTMSQFGESVSNNFLSSPFGLGGQTTTVTPTPETSPALRAAADQLEAAQAHLAALQSPTGDLNQRLANAAAAHQVETTVRQLQAKVDRLSQPVTTTTNALDEFRNVMESDTQRALEFTEALKTLASEGLNPKLYRELASSGDVTFATALAAAGAGQVADVNALYVQREEAVAQLAAMTVQRAYGAQQAAMKAQIAHQSRLIHAVDRSLGHLDAQVRTLGRRVENGAERGVAGLRDEMRAVRRDLADLPRQLEHAHR